MVGAPGPEVDQVGGVAAQSIELVEIEVDIELRSHRRYVEGGVGGPPDGRIHPDGVLYRLTGSAIFLAVW